MKKLVKLDLSRNSFTKTSKTSLSLTTISFQVFATCPVPSTNSSQSRNSVPTSNTKKNWNKSKKKSKVTASAQPCSKQATPVLPAWVSPAASRAPWSLLSSPTRSTAASWATSTTTRTATAATRGLAILHRCSSSSRLMTSRCLAMHSWWGRVEARARGSRSRGRTNSLWARRWDRSFRKSGRICWSLWQCLEATQRCPKAWNLRHTDQIIYQNSQKLR